MKRIPLSRGMFALVDDADYPWLMQWKWYAMKRRGEFYAARHESPMAGGFTIYMHQQIALTPPGFETDHVNRKRLDNRRNNLRWATPSQNRVNCQGTRRNNSSGFIGVYRSGKKWAAQITINRKTKKLGLYPTPEEAAIARDIATFSHHGTMATLNFPELACAARNKAAEDRKDREAQEMLERIRKAG